MADELYLQTLGQVVWNFALLRWDVVYLIVRMNKDNWKSAHLDESSRQIAKAFRESTRFITDSRAEERFDRAGSFMAPRSNYSMAFPSSNTPPVGPP